MQPSPTLDANVSGQTLVRKRQTRPAMGSQQPGLVGRLRRQLLGISPREATFARRGFREGDAAARRRLEQIGLTFLDGYHAALEQTAPAALAARLARVELEWRGFAFEGAAMALALLDALWPWRAHRWERFLAGPGQPHTYMVHVGAGWALARLGRPVESTLRRLDPLLGWLVVDGYGFHEGYFAWRRYLGPQPPSRLRGYAERVFDQGLGRSLWFVQGADAGRVASTVQALAPGRQGDLWSGVGLACSYAGGADAATFQALRKMAGGYLPEVAQGAAFAAAAHARAGTAAPHTELACQTLTGLSATQAATVTQAALVGLPPGPPGAAYETWRRRIRAHFQ